MKFKYPALLALVAASSVQASDMVITGVIDGPLSGGVPKAVELFVINDIADLSACGVGFANNGGGTDGEEFTFPSGSATAGSYIYVASETTGFTSFFGFAPDHATGSAGINGDDAIELFCNDTVIDIFGDIDTDGSGEAWEYLDGWAYRTADTGPDGSAFELASWSFSGPNALDGSSDNDTASTPFPLKNYAEEIDDGDDGNDGGGDDPTAGDCVNCEDVTKVADADTFDASVYYADVLTEIDNVSSTDVIKEVLSETITNGSVVLSYSQVWSALTITDEDPDDSDNIILWYTGSPRAKNLNGGNSGDWNREHSWPSSHGFGDSDGGFSAYTDIHHLRPSDVTVNSTRGNLDFDDSDTEVSAAPGNYVDGDSFEPRDDIKGDVARMMFYMDTRYENLAAFDATDNTPDLLLVDDFTSTDSNELGRLCRLWEWHLEDPVDDAEMTRNDRIYEYQGNRNPFIDNPEWAEMFYLTEACDSDTDDGGDDDGNDGSPATVGDLIISGVIDGPLSGGTPKAIEIFVVNDVSDLSTCGIGSANNGGGSDEQEFTFDPVSASKGDFIYIASEDSQFESFLGFAPDYTSGSAGINGDDAIELFCDDEVADVFGDINVDGNGEAWEYLDGWAYRTSMTGPDGAVFDIENWTFSGANALDGESDNATAEIPFPIGTFYTEETLIITGVFDGPLSGGTPKTIEFYAVTDISDLSVFGFGSANNGGGSDEQEYTFTGSASAGDYIYIASEDSQFEAFFGFAPNDTDGAAGINGDDAIELFKDGTVVDVFGDINQDGTGQAWDYLDGWAYRVAGTGPDGDTFALASWVYSGTNVMDGESTNDSAATPFPLGSYAGGGDDDDGDTVLIGACFENATLISAIQGNGDVSPLAGETLVLEAIVSAAFPAISGFFVQEETVDMDADSLTSEGLFVYYEGDLPAEGSIVRVVGTVAEFYEKTQVAALEVSESCGTDVAQVTSFILPFADSAEAEALEGMLVTSAQELVVSNNYSLGQYGEVTLSANRLFNPTNQYLPGSDDAVALAAENALNQVILDDGANGSYPEDVIYPLGGLTASNTLRTGDTVSTVTGAMDYSFSNYRIIPTEYPTIVSTNARESAPDIAEGNLKVASLNMLNYFTTLDEGDNTCGPNSLGCRGADNAEEFARQTPKSIAALVALDADIIGLMEVENNGFGDDSAIADLVTRLNTELGEGTYAAVDAGGTVGSDAIMAALVYKPAVVELVGEPAILTSDNSISDEYGALFDDSNTRPTVAQKFAIVGNGEELVVSVNHYRSKGGSCDDDTNPIPGDDDNTNGQGACNGTRTRTSEAVIAFLADTFPDTATLIIGDLNAYAKEDPITTLESAGYTNLVNYFQGDEAYSYTYFGLFGYLDHALANNKALSKVVDVTEWHINSDEPFALDYNTENKSEQQLIDFYAADAYRMSDHDPVVIAMQFDAPVSETETDADVNQDGSVDFSDYFAILGMLGSATGDANFNAIADYDGDDLISPLDLQAWYQLYLSQ